MTTQLALFGADKIRLLKVFVLGLFLFYLFQVIKYDFKAKCVFLALMVRRVILACSDEVCCKVNLLSDLIVCFTGGSWGIITAR